MGILVGKRPVQGQTSIPTIERHHFATIYRVHVHYRIMDPALVEEKDRTALEWKDIGNDFFSKKDYARAAEAYESGLQEATSDDFSVSVTLRSNLVMVLIKLEDFQRAEQECNSILEADPENTKGMFVKYE